MHTYSSDHTQHMIEMSYNRSSSASLDAIMRTMDQQVIYDAVIRRVHDLDLLSRDDNLRLGGLRNVVGLSDRERRIEELCLDDLVRRYVHPNPKTNDLDR